MGNAKSEPTSYLIIGCTNLVGFCFMRRFHFFKPTLDVIDRQIGARGPGVQALRPIAQLGATRLNGLGKRKNPMAIVFVNTK